MDSNSLHKTLNAILNTLPRTLAISSNSMFWLQKDIFTVGKPEKKNFKNREITTFTSRLSSFNEFFQHHESIGELN